MRQLETKLYFFNLSLFKRNLSLVFLAIGLISNKQKRAIPKKGNSKITINQQFFVYVIFCENSVNRQKSVLRNQSVIMKINKCEIVFKLMIKSIPNPIKKNAIAVINNSIKKLILFIVFC